MTDEANQNDAPFASVAVIGLGLIGASVAAALAAKMPGVSVFGVDTDPATCATATGRGWCAAATGPDDAAFRDFIRNDCELVVIATPVAAVDDYLGRLRDWGYAGLVTDTISTKGHILAAAEALLPAPARYIPGHPMAGSEQNGIAGARADLFEGANWILCPDERTAPEDFQAMHEFITGLESRVVSLRREEHDAAIAIVSHVPHMVASSLMQLACAHADDTGSIMRLAAGGFKDSTRIAAGSPKLWCGIAFDNAEALRDGLSEMAAIIGSFADALAAGDRDTFTRLLAEAAEARRALPAAWVPCNIQSIDIDHISEGNAVLSLILTDEGDVGALSIQLINAGFSVSFSPIMPKEYAHAD